MVPDEPQASGEVLVFLQAVDGWVRRVWAPADGPVLRIAGSDEGGRRGRRRWTHTYTGDQLAAVALLLGGEVGEHPLDVIARLAAAGDLPPDSLPDWLAEHGVVGEHDEHLEMD